MSNEELLNLAIFTAFGVIAVTVPQLWFVGVFMMAVVIANVGSRHV